MIDLLLTNGGESRVPRIDRPQKKVRNQMQINRADNGECQAHQRSRTPTCIMPFYAVYSVYVRFLRLPIDVRLVVSLVF